MKSHRTRRAATMVLVAILATGTLAACGDADAKKPEFAALGPIGTDEGAGPVDEENGAVTPPGSKSESVGECFIEADSVDSSGNTTLRTSDCAESHDSEVFFAYESALDTWNEDAIEDEALSQCFPAFASYVGVEFESSTLQVGYLSSSIDTWALGDREIVCYLTESSMVEGSAKGSGK